MANWQVNTACATSNYAFINAAMHIRAGQADIMLAGGTEAAVTPMGLAGRGPRTRSPVLSGAVCRCEMTILTWARQ